MLDTPTTGSADLLSTLPSIESDSLLALIAMANGDTRPEKIDAGVGVYKNAKGETPILRAVKAAEKLLWERQETKSYLGGRGDVAFPKLLAPYVLGHHADDERIDGLQTPGGCGALSLAVQLIAAARPGARVWVGTPTWPNHIPILSGAGLQIERYGFYDRDERRICFEQMVEALDGARPGDIVLLHGCCHNPTGADLDEDQWADIARICAHRRLLPLIDFAYQGLGRGFEGDRRGVEMLLDQCDEAIVAQSCDKNFGLYRDRVGCLYVKTGSKAATQLAMRHVLQIAREMWSMPPDHGAATVSTVLSEKALTADWLAEVGEMRERIAKIRGRIAAADPRLAYIGQQFGMFSILPLERDQVRRLREDKAIYVADSGRFNVLGMADEAVDRFVAAIVETLDG